MAPSAPAAEAPAAVAFQPGAKVWVTGGEEEVWTEAEVVRSDGDAVLVRAGGGATRPVPAKDVYLAEPRTPVGVEDMVKLNYLHEPGVLHNLGYRYAMNEIYTYTGDILIAVNPFQRLPHLYNELVMNQYKARRAGAPARAPLSRAAQLARRWPNSPF